MPTNRRLKQRVSRHRVNNAGVAAFAEALPLRLHREEQIASGKNCSGVGTCGTCDKYEDLVEQVGSALALTPDDWHPIDVTDCNPAPWFTDQDAERWQQAREVYRDLCDAAGIEPVTHCEISDTIRHQQIIRWMERHCRIPEGPDLGKRPRLREWQRDAIRSIYGNGLGALAPMIRKKLGIK